MCRDQLFLNKNHRLLFDGEYRGKSLLGGNFPMVTEYLDALNDVIGRAADQYSRVFAFRFDLRLPLDFEGSADGFSNTAISRFVASLKAKIRHNRATAVRTRAFAHDTRVRYFWVREIGDGGRVHYHFTVLLNAQAFNWLGRFESNGRNMANRVWEAWASALKVNVERAKALVHFPQNPSYELRRDDPESIATFFRRASYLCKARSKQYGHGHHGYGASRS